LNSIDLAVLTETGEPVGITNYDITFVVSGTGKSKSITAIPSTNSNAPIPDGLELHDLESSVIKLTPDEMLDVQRGVTLKDIFASRRATSLEKDIDSSDIVADAREQVQNLFKE
jgi:hypothetical protein